MIDNPQGDESASLSDIVVVTVNPLLAGTMPPAPTLTSSLVRNPQSGTTSPVSDHPSMPELVVSSGDEIGTVSAFNSDSSTESDPDDVCWWERANSLLQRHCQQCNSCCNSHFGYLGGLRGGHPCQPFSRSMMSTVGPVETDSDSDYEYESDESDFDQALPTYAMSVCHGDQGHYRLTWLGDDCTCPRCGRAAMRFSIWHIETVTVYWFHDSEVMPLCYWVELPACGEID